MYHIELTFGSETLVLDHAHGFDIATISGLTGMSARLNTVQSNVGMGEIYTDGSVGGIKLTVQGYILDKNTTAKRLLIDSLTPMREGVLTLYNIKHDNFDEPYRAIDVVVFQTPTVTQTEHSKFAFVLYAPCPFWRALEYETVGAGTTAIKGTVDADYNTMRVMVPANVHLAEFILYIDQGTAAAQHIYLDLRRLTAGYVAGATSVVIRRVKGRLEIFTSDGQGNDTNIIQTLHTESDLLRVPPGNHTFIAYAKDENAQYITNSIAWGFYYYPQFSGVALSGI